MSRARRVPDSVRSSGLDDRHDVSYPRARRSRTRRWTGTHAQVAFARGARRASRRGARGEHRPSRDAGDDLNPPARPQSSRAWRRGGGDDGAAAKGAARSAVVKDYNPERAAKYYARRPAQLARVAQIASSLGGFIVTSSATTRRGGSSQTPSCAHPVRETHHCQGGQLSTARPSRAVSR